MCPCTFLTTRTSCIVSRVVSYISSVTWSISRATVYHRQEPRDIFIKTWTTHTDYRLPYREVIGTHGIYSGTSCWPCYWRLLDHDYIYFWIFIIGLNNYRELMSCSWGCYFCLSRTVTILFCNMLLFSFVSNIF